MTNVMSDDIAPNNGLKTVGAAHDLQVPILDLGPFLTGKPGALARTAEHLRYIGEHLGFHYISNHGISETLIEQAFAEAKRFHDQPLEEKLKIKINEHMQGYMPIKGTTTRSSDLSEHNLPSQNEAFFIQREVAPGDPEAGSRYHTPNLWPESLPGFKTAALEYFDALDVLAKRMLPIYAAALNLAPDFFDDAFQRPYATLRMTHYPVTSYVQNEYGVAPHTDSSFITLLASNKVSGLQIKTSSGSWADAPPVEGTFVVNSGDILNRWSNGRFLSTPHRAYNLERTSRYAIPFFFHPDPHYPMECLATCTGPGNPPLYPRETTAEYMEWFTGKNYDHIRQMRNIRD